MIIVAGAGHRKNEKSQLKDDKYCFNCNNTSKWILQKSKHFLTLFFLPVAPYKTEYMLFCPICGNSIKLEKTGYEKMKTSDLTSYK